MDTSAGTGLVGSMVKPPLEDKQAYYRQIITEEMKQVACAPVNGEIQTIAILDPIGDHYQLLDMGWDDADRRIFQPIIHIDLIGTKVWIQENTTDLDIAKVFVKSGIEASDIVLGLHSRSLRRFSEYAIE
jgi:XisI protein